MIMKRMIVKAFLFVSRWKAIDEKNRQTKQNLLLLILPYLKQLL